MTITHLRCDFLENPLGLGTPNPSLSWRLETDRAGAHQVAYRLRCATTREKLDSPDLWDSGRIESNQNFAVTYKGQALQSRQRVFWSVEIEDETGALTTSEAAWWEMGLLEKGDWQASWIGGNLAGNKRTPVAAPYLRTEFSLEKPVKSARLYATSLGVYECELNGQRVGDIELAPGWTTYDKRVQYQTYDVTDLLQTGDNAWGAIVGDGWYSGCVAWMGREVYGTKPAFLGQLEVEYEDGSTQVFTSNGDWKFAYGPILGSDMQGGENYDARQEFGPWSQTGFDADLWIPVLLPEVPAIELSAPLGPPVRVTQELTPIKHHRAGGALIFDMGQNMVGRIRLKTTGKAGQTIQLRYAETLAGGPTATDGPIYTTNLRGAKQTDLYTLKGDPDGETFEPRFTFHGFRYVEISGLSSPVEEDTLTGVVIHSDTALIGDFECSDPLLNQLQKNIDWGWRGNSLELPTDCPQRDERLGWTGDAQVFIRTSLLNRDAAAFWRAWMRNVMDAQSSDGAIPCTIPSTSPASGAHGNAWHDGGPAWADAATICPWTLYQLTGDKLFITENYPMMSAYVEYQNATSKDGMRCYEGCSYFRGFGDWLALDGGPTEGNTPYDLLGTAFFAYSSALVAKMARVLGEEADSARFDGYAETAKAAFNREFVTPAGRIIPGTQTCYVLALHFDFLPENLRQSAADFLVRDIRKRRTHLATGFVGTPYLLYVLARFGHLDVAYELLEQKSWPSWLYSVTQGGTTIWERWNGWTQETGFADPGMNSFNHYAYGAVGDWLFSAVAGISEGTPGYTELHLAPQPGGTLTWTKAHLDTPQGRVESSWRFEGEKWIWEGIVPPNTTANVQLPKIGERGGQTQQIVAGPFRFEV